jgi:hypothetical protein
LTFFKNYFITGDYVVAGTSLWQQGVPLVAKGNITIGGVPAGAEILAALLYVQTAEKEPGSGIDNAEFDGKNLGPGNHSIAKALNRNSAMIACWSHAPQRGRPQSSRPESGACGVFGFVAAIV